MRWLLDADTRFAIALLANISNKTFILSLIGQRFPGEDSVDKFAGCIERVSDDVHLGIKSTNAWRLMLECLLRGIEKPDEIKEVFSGKYGQKQVNQQEDKLILLSQAIKNFWLLRPMLGVSGAIP